MAEQFCAARIPLRMGLLLMMLSSVFYAGMLDLSEARTMASIMERLHLVTAPNESAAMRNLRKALKVRDAEWPEASDPCASWNGVQCEDGHVVEIMFSGLERAHATLDTVAGWQELSPLSALQLLPFLRSLNASGFSLVTPLPTWLGGLIFLEVMDFTSASMIGSIPASVGQLSNLKILRLANNNLKGHIPFSIGNLSSLAVLDLSNNELLGCVPETLGNLEDLSILNLSMNRLEGRVPSELGGLHSLQQILLAGNALVGLIPPDLGSLVHLTHLDLSSNFLTGNIPVELGRLWRLTDLNLGFNELLGAIPSEVTNCSRLELLKLHHNRLTGSLPLSIGLLRSLITFDVSLNNLSGQLPSQISNLTGAQSIILSDNSFFGSVPEGLSLLRRLRVLDLSGNFLSGSFVGIAFNAPKSDSGALVMTGRNCFTSPLSAVQNQRSPSDCSGLNVGSSVTFPGAFNERMLAEVVSIAPSPSGSFWKRNRTRVAVILAGSFAALLVIVLTAILGYYILQYERRLDGRRRTKLAAALQRSAANKELAKKALNIPSGRSINVARLGESFPYALLVEATGHFDHSNMIMAGHTGDLYKGVFNNRMPVVVKRVDLTRFKKDLYMYELEFFGRVTHTRFVPLLGHCLEMEEEKLLVYKYMPNGDLAYALHKKDSPSRPEDVLQSLDWITRLKIAIGVAEGLVHLHHECSPPLVHRDIKASSILLDDKFEVRLGSLSEARVQQAEHQSSLLGRFLRLSRSSDQLDAGQPVASCSYDVFCFGKVLLELVSGKLGISGSIDPGADDWLEWALPLIDIHEREPLSKLMDPSLIVDEDLMEEVWATAIIAKSCLNPKPSRRPNMKHILRALENPQKVVRDDSSGPIKSRTSSYGSWNSALFGGWRHFSSENAFGFGSSLREEHSSEMNPRAGHAGPGNDSARYHRRPGSRESREIVPVPLSVPTNTHTSDEADSRV